MKNSQLKFRMTPNPFTFLLKLILLIILISATLVSVYFTVVKNEYPIILLVLFFLGLSGLYFKEHIMDSLMVLYVYESEISVLKPLYFKIIKIHLYDIQNFYQGVYKNRNGKFFFVTLRFKDEGYIKFKKIDFWNYDSLISFLKVNLPESFEQ